MKCKESCESAKIELELRMILVFFGIAISMLLILSLRVNAEGERLTVDDSGGAEYEKIQDAVDDATEGDTILVYEGTYNENVIIDKTLTLIGNGTENTTVDGGWSGDVIKINVNYVNISGFSIRDGNNNGILINSDYNIISNCNISTTDLAGIYLDKSSKNKISNCKISNDNPIGIRLYKSCLNNSIFNCNISNNRINGIDLHQCELSNNTIYNCNISSNNDGIRLFESSNNKISDCNINNHLSGRGIWHLKSSNNTNYNCKISNNRYGIKLDESSNILISNNNFIEDGIDITGDEISHFIHNIENNTVNGKPLLYYKNKNNIVLNGKKVGQIILTNCSNFEIKNINISNTDLGVLMGYCKDNTIITCNSSNNDNGIFLYYSNNNTISNCKVANIELRTLKLDESNKNVISKCNFSNNKHGPGVNLIKSSYNIISKCNIINNYYGINFDRSNNNTIFNSNITNNNYGIYIKDSSDDNTIFHNNFIDNDPSAHDICSNQWDNGKEGNYWDDYDGVDNDGNGIGDTPYNISGGDNQDRYPLMEPFGTEKKNWTFIVYLDADNDLEKYGIKDINEMEQIGSTDEVNIVVLFDRWDGTNEPEDDDTSNGNWTNTKYYYVTKDNDTDNITSQELENMTEQNMGAPDTLFNFVNNSINDFPAENYILVLWNHGSGFLSVCSDEETGADSEDYLTMVELKEALERIYENNSKNKIDIIGFDACLMQMAEVCYQIKDYADYSVGSEEVVPGDGWSYDLILKNLTKNPGMKPKDLASEIVNDYFEYFGKNGDETLSGVDLSLMDNVTMKLDDFADKLLDNFSKYEKEIWDSRNKTQYYEEKTFIDLYHFAYLINQTINDKEIQNSSNDLMNAIVDSVFVEEHGNKSVNSTGLSFYFPLNQSSQFKLYEKLEFSNNTIWDDFLIKFFNIEDWFNDVYYYTYDDSGDGLNDSVDVQFDVDTNQEYDEVEVHGYLNYSTSGETVHESWILYSIYNTEEDYKYLSFQVPSYKEEGDYYVYLELYNSLGELNDKWTSEDFYLYPYKEENSQFYGWVNNSETKEPVEGVELHFWNDEIDYHNSTWTNEFGYYEINVPESEFEVDISVEGYYDYYEEGIYIGENEEKEYSVELDPKPEENSTFYGWVNNSETGEAIEGAEIDIWENKDDYNNHTYTDENGYYEINLPEGEYDIEIRANGFYNNFTDGIYIGNEESIELTVELDPKPEEKSTFFGWVNNSENGQPIEGANLHVWNNEGYDNGTNTEINGYYEIYVHGGKFNIDIWVEGFYSNNTPDVSIGEEERKEFSLELEPEPEENSTFYGWINNSENGKPIEGAEVHFFVEDEYHNSTFTDDVGYYELNVPEDTYNVYIEAEGYYENYNEDIYIQENEKLEYSVDLKPKPEENSTFYGWVNNSENGESIEGANIHVWDNEDYDNGTSTNENGYYEINVPAGEYSMDTYTEGYHYYYDNGISIGDEERLEYSFELDPKPPENSTFYGWVNDSETGNPIGGANIHVWNNEKYDNGTNTNKNGYYRINVSEGEYNFNVWTEGYYPNDTTEISIGDKENKKFNIQLEPMPPENSTFYGWVNDSETGNAIEGADVHFFIDEKYHNFTTTNEEGYYEINVPEDTYNIYVDVNGYHGYYMEDLYIKKDEWIEYSVELTQKEPENSTIYGWVNNSKNSLPIQGANINVDMKDKYHNDTSTNESGYYEINVPEGTFYINIWAEGFIGYSEDGIYIQDWENIEISAELEPKPEENSILRGYLKDFETNNPIVDEVVQINSKEYEYGNQTSTNDTGYYEFNLFEGEWEFDVYLEGYIPYEEDFYIEDYEEVWLDIFLEPLPAPNATIKGYLKDENGKPIETQSQQNGMIFAHNIALEAGNRTFSNETGYYEFDIWSGLNMVGAQADGYYANFTIVMLSDNEILWHNITLFNELENDATIKGNITNEKGEPIKDCEVFLANYIIGFPFGNGNGDDWEFSTWTDNSGYYEIKAPAGDYFLVAIYNEEDFEMGTIFDVQLISDDEIFKDFGIIKSTVKPGSTTTFKDWNSISFEAYMPFSMDAPIEVTRFEVDFFGGNKDGFVNETEAQKFEELFEFMMEFEGNDNDNTTEEDFLVDDIYYLFENEYFFEEFEFVNMKGSVLDSSPVFVLLKGNQTSNETIKENREHTLKVNVTYEKGEDEFGIKNIILPDGFTMYDYDATENITVTGMFTSKITLEFIGEFGDDEDFEWVIINVVTNSPPIVDAGVNQIVYKGDEVHFLGSFNDPDVDDTHTIEWDFGDGNKSTGSLTPVHKFSKSGNYTVTLTITDKYDGMDNDSLKITVIHLTEKKTITLENNAVVEAQAAIIGESGDISLKSTKNPDPQDPGSIGIFIDIELSSGELLWLNITVNYIDLPENVNAENLRMYWWNVSSKKWMLINNSGVDTKNKIIWANVTHLTIFAPRDEDAVALQTEKYADLEIIEITFSNSNPKDGETIEIIVKLQNIGNAVAKNIKIELYVSGVLKDTKTMESLEVGKPITVKFSWSATKGTHEIKIWIEAENETLKYQVNNEDAKIITVEEADEDKFLVLLIVIPIIVIIAVIVGIVVIMKGKKQEPLVIAEPSKIEPEKEETEEIQEESEISEIPEVVGKNKEVEEESKVVEEETKVEEEKIKTEGKEELGVDEIDKEFESISKDLEVLESGETRESFAKLKARILENEKEEIVEEEKKEE